MAVGSLFTKTMMTDKNHLIQLMVCGPFLIFLDFLLRRRKITN
jgi:hypothetical protein